MAEKEPRLSKISKMHYGKLVLRGSLFLAALAVYVPNRLRGAEGLYETFAGFTGLIPFVWVVFMDESTDFKALFRPVVSPPISTVMPAILPAIQAS